MLAKKHIRHAVMACCLVLLSGCNEEEFCQTIGRQGAVISSSSGVQVENSNRAFDQNLSTSAQMYSISGSGTAVFNVTGSQSDAGFAGVLLQTPPGQLTQVRMIARFEGGVVASGNAGTQSDSSLSCQGLCERNGEQVFFAIPVDQAFDEIQAEVQTSGTTADTQVFEMCVKD